MRAVNSLLQSYPCPFGNNDEIRQPINHYRPLALLDHARQHRECRRQAQVLSVLRIKDIPVGTLSPFDVYRRVDGFFHVFAVEVERFRLYVGERAWEAEDVPEDGVLSKWR